MEVNVVDQAGKNYRVRLPDDVPVGQLSSALRRQLNLPDTDERGRLQVVLHHKVTGKDLPPEKSLADERVGEGDVLKLRMEAVAG
jgi:uncharacterized ubiquitin-like protein YukD